ncbi:unnamed protein product [Vicia faba]|uniref:Uncharacterized protein n=1 Tax=Vicia faba TaxID=3906 RepID=A0AAV0YPD7_VICFA|nr:unnamed protein product [Vicia faba]
MKIDLKDLEFGECCAMKILKIKSDGDKGVNQRVDDLMKVEEDSMQFIDEIVQELEVKIGGRTRKSESEENGDDEDGNPPDKSLNRECEFGLHTQADFEYGFKGECRLKCGPDTCELRFPNWFRMATSRMQQVSLMLRVRTKLQSYFDHGGLKEN